MLQISCFDSEVMFSECQDGKVNYVIKIVNFEVCYFFFIFFEYGIL